MKEVNTHLEERAFVERQHEVELEGEVKELMEWKKTAIALLEDREASMAILQNEKDLQTERATGLERQLLDFQLELQQLTADHAAANQQLNKLTLTISKLEKEERLLKGVAVQGDMDDAKAQAHLVNLQGQVQSLENAKVMMQRDLEKEDGMIEELEETVKSKTEEAKKIAAEAKKDVAAKEKVIQGLNARIVDLDQ